MKRLFATVLLSVFMVLGLSACVPDALVRHEVIEKRTMVVVNVDSSLLEPCHDASPPPVMLYTQVNRDQKEALLTGYIADLILDNKRCSLDKLTLKTMLTKQKATVDQFNADEDLRVKNLLEEKKK